VSVDILSVECDARYGPKADIDCMQKCNLPIEWLDPKKVTKPTSHNALVRGLRYVGHTFRFGSSDFRRSKSRRSPSEPLIQSVRFDQAGHHFAGVCTLLLQGRQ